MIGTWSKATIQDLVQPIETWNPRKAPEDTFNYIDVSAVSRSSFSVVGTTPMKGKDAPSRARRRVRSGDILFATIRPTLKRIAEIPTELDGAICSTGFFVLRPQNNVLSRYLFYWLLGESFSDAMEKLQRGASYPAVSDGDVRQQAVLLPAMAEQKQIVGILDEAFAGIETAVNNTEKNLANAGELLESYLSQIFQNATLNWAQSELIEICTFTSGGTPSKKEERYWEGSIPWISGRDMKSTRLCDSKLHISPDAIEESATKIAPTGSILILVRGMGLAHGAQIAELTAPCAFNQDIRAIHPIPDIVPRYLVFALRDRINGSSDVLSSAAHGTLKIDSDGLKRILIPVPSHQAQVEMTARIDEIITATDNLRTTFDKKLASLAELKQSLLQKAFSGELTADRAEREVESATI